jgi:hypothetical protein
MEDGRTSATDRESMESFSALSVDSAANTRNHMRHRILAVYFPATTQDLRFGHGRPEHDGTYGWQFRVMYASNSNVI